MSSAAGYAPMGGMRGAMPNSAAAAGSSAGPSYGRMMAPPYGGATSPPMYGAQPSIQQRSMPPQQAMPPPPPQQQPGPQGTLPPGTKIMVGQIVVTVQKYLSQGGFAHVYLVTTDKPIPVPVSATTVPGGTSVTTRGETLHVLKRMAVPDKEALAGVRSEVEIHKSIRAHPNIVHFVEASASALRGGGYEVFILMEYCSGGGIIDLMNARLRTRLSEPEVLKIFGDVAAGLQVMHSMDPPIMHRDLKVENILLSPPPKSNPGVGPTYKLCDFGSAKPLLSRKPARSLEEVKRLEADLNMHTTLQYRAPEMVDVYQRRTIDEKADIWAMGVLLYKLCYYTTPFEENGGGPLAILNARYRFPNMPPYSQRLKDLIASMLQEHSHMRPTIEEVMLSVHRILGTRPPAFLLKSSSDGLERLTMSPSPALMSPPPRLPHRTSHETPTRQGSTADDLIAIGPSDADRRRAEDEELKKRVEGITPMRRGRPAKPTSTSPDKTGTPSRQPGIGAPRPPSASPTRPPQASHSASIDGFGDSFAPSEADTALSRPASVLKHSPALPGFDTPSRASPAPPLTSPVSERTKAFDSSRFAQAANSRPPPQLPTTNEGPLDDAATSRFPSVEELDMRYPTKKPVAAAASSSSSSSASIAVPGLSDRDSVSAMAGRFNNTGKPAIAPSPSVRQNALAGLQQARSPAAASPVNSPQQPHLPARKQMHRDWLRETPSGSSTDQQTRLQRTESISSAASRPTTASQVKKAEDAESSGSEEDGPEDADATVAPRAMPTGSTTVSEKRTTMSHRHNTSIDLDLMEKAPELRPRPGRVQPPSWLSQQSSAPQPSPKPALLSKDLTSPKVAEPGIAPSVDSQFDATGPKQSASAPAWDEDDEEMHFLPQPTIGTAHETAPQPMSPAVTSNLTSTSSRMPESSSNTRLIDIDDSPIQTTVSANAITAIPMAPVKKYADASTSPHNASPIEDETKDSLERGESQTSFDAVPPTTNALPIVAPKPERSTSAKDIGSMVSQLESTSLSSPGASKKMPEVPKKPSTISNRLKAYESLANGVPSAKPLGPSASTTAISSEAAKRKPPVVAPKPASISKTVGLKPWEREAMEREQVQKYGVIRNEDRDSPDVSSPQQPPEPMDSPLESVVVDKQPGEAQERFRGVSSLISQWQNNASRGAPGWGTVGSHDSDVGDRATSKGAKDDDEGATSPRHAHRASAHLSTDLNGLTRSSTLGRQRMVSREV